MTIEDDHWHRLPSGLSAFGRNDVRFQPEPVSGITGMCTESRRGNHRLKNAMFLAAFASLRSAESKAFYGRKRAEGKRHNAAVICLARRRCNVMLAMLRDNQPYKGGYRPAGQLADAA